MSSNQNEPSFPWNWANTNPRAAWSITGILIATLISSTFVISKTLMESALTACETFKSEYQNNLSKCQSNLSSCEEARAKLESELDKSRCLAGVACEFFVASLKYSNNEEGEPNRIKVDLQCSQASSARLFAAVRVEDERGGRSWWASDVLPHRDGKHEVTVYLHRLRPGMRLVPVIIEERRLNAIQPNRALSGHGADFEEICEW